MNSQGDFALKFAVMRRNNEEIKSLIMKGADINQIDNKKRNVLHHAINMSSATGDTNFETEELLIDLGIDINQRDSKERVPLHYAFVKTKDWASSKPIDPIEAVSLLCAKSSLDIDVPDKWLKTPLHYAAQRAALVSTFYLLERDANLESTDINGNTALGIALYYKHYNYAIMLIQKKADVKVSVYDEKSQDTEQLEI